MALKGRCGLWTSDDFKSSNTLIPLADDASLPLSSPKASFKPAGPLRQTQCHLQGMGSLLIEVTDKSNEIKRATSNGAQGVSAVLAQQRASAPLNKGSSQKPMQEIKQSGLRAMSRVLPEKHIISSTKPSGD